MGTTIAENVDLHWMQTVRQALAFWGLEDADVKALSLSENATYRVDPHDDGGPYVLRLHRPGFRTPMQVRSEMAWLDEVRADGRVMTAKIIPTAAGESFCTYVNDEGVVQLADLMEFLEGSEPRDVGLASSLERIGGVAAVLHSIAHAWEPPSWFDRPVWDEQRILGDLSDYGDWRDTPEVTAEMRPALEAAERECYDQLAAYGKDAGNFGVVHTDLRSSNLLIAGDGQIKVLDFDDCGPGWYLFDVATSFTFEDGKPDIEDNIFSYLKGYREAGGLLPDADFAYLPAMLMARRLDMTAWVEKRKETDWARQIRSTFPAGTARMARAFCRGEFLPELVEAAESGTLTDLVMGR